MTPPSPSDWTAEQWHVHTMKMAAMLDGMTITDANKLLDLLRTIVAGGTVFRMDSPEFQKLVHQVVHGEIKG